MQGSMHSCFYLINCYERITLLNHQVYFILQKLEVTFDHGFINLYLEWEEVRAIPRSAQRLLVAQWLAAAKHALQTSEPDPQPYRFHFEVLLGILISLNLSVVDKCLLPLLDQRWPKIGVCVFTSNSTLVDPTLNGPLRIRLPYSELVFFPL